MKLCIKCKKEFTTPGIQCKECRRKPEVNANLEHAKHRHIPILDVKKITAEDEAKLEELSMEMARMKQVRSGIKQSGTESTDSKENLNDKR